MSTEQKQLTAEDIDAMAAGPEMDALLAERVFGFAPLIKTIETAPCPDGRVGCLVVHKREVYRFANGDIVPGYSQYIAAAWQVVEHLRGQDWEMTLSVNHYATEPWDCRLFQTEGGKLDAPSKRIIAHGPDAPTAISRCAYKTTILQTD